MIYITIESYKKSGKFYETWSDVVDIAIYDTPVILEFIYKKTPRLKNYNFVFEAVQEGRVNKRLVLNQKK